jgi:hypothetical protein
MLQGGRSPFRVPDEEDLFFNLPNPSSRTMALGSTQLLKKATTTNEGKWPPARKADSLTAICEPIIYRKYGSLNSSQPYGPSRHVTGIVLLFLPLYNFY